MQEQSYYEQYREVYEFSQQKEYTVEHDTEFLGKIKPELLIFKQATIEGYSAGEVAKRIQWIETQLEGFQKRTLIIRNVNGNTHDYYKILKGLQDKLEEQCRISESYKKQLDDMNLKVADLELDIQGLRNNLKNYDATRNENVVYKEFYAQLKVTVQQGEHNLLNKLKTSMENFELKLAGIDWDFPASGQPVTTPMYRVRVGALVTDLERMMKKEFVLADVENIISGFLHSLEINKHFELYRTGQLIRHQYESLKRWSAAKMTLCRQLLQKVLVEYPQLQTRLDLSVFDSITETTQITIHQNIVIVNLSDLTGRICYYQVQEKRTMALLALISRKLKLAFQRYSYLQLELGDKIYEFAMTYVFDQAISLQELEHLVEVVKYKTEIVKVNEVYIFSSQQSKRKIYYLRVMIRTLLDELNRLRLKTGALLQIQQQVIAMITAQLWEVVSVEDILRVFTCLPKLLEVEQIIERDISRPTGYLTQHVPIIMEQPRYLERKQIMPVVLTQEIAVYNNRHDIIVLKHEKPVPVLTEKPHNIIHNHDILIDRLLVEDLPQPVTLKEEVPFYQTEIKEVERFIVTERLKEKPVEYMKTVNVPVESRVNVPEIVTRYEERLVPVTHIVTKLVQVPVPKQVLQQVPVVVDRPVKHIVEVPKLVEKPVPIFITNTIEKPKEVINTIEKIVAVTTVEERLVQTEVKVQVPCIQHVEKEIIVKEIVKVKGDEREVIKEVECIVQKPLIQEKLITKEIEIEKEVPLYITAERPVVVEVSCPYIEYQPKLIHTETEKYIPIRQEVMVEVIKEVPVPIIVEKQVLIEKEIIREKIVEKMVEVPRVVEVQKIVEKIIVVPRIIEHIVQVPQIIEKFVEIRVPELHIVEIQKKVNVEVIREVAKIIEQPSKPYLETVEKFTIVEKEKIVSIHTDRQVSKPVEVERRIPYEVIREKEVPMIQDRIIEIMQTIYDIEYRDREVMVPMRYEIPKEILVEKAVEVQKIIEKIVQVPQLITQTEYLERQTNNVEIKEIQMPVFVDRIKEIPSDPIVITKTEYREVIVPGPAVKVVETIEKIEPVPYIVEKMVFNNQIYKEGVPILQREPVWLNYETLREVEVPRNYFVEKEIPHTVYRDRRVDVRAVLDRIKEVNVRRPQKADIVNHTEIKEVHLYTEKEKYIKEDRIVPIKQQYPIDKIVYTAEERQARTIMVHDKQRTLEVRQQPVYHEKVVEKVLLLPQILEIIRNVHHISEESFFSGFHALIGIDVKVHIVQYIQICQTLKIQLQAILLAVTDKVLILKIESVIALLVKFIQFPMIVEVPKEVPKLVPVYIDNPQSTEIAQATFLLIEKLIIELKRVSSLNINLQLDINIQNIFITNFIAGSSNLFEKLMEYIKQLQAGQQWQFPSYPAPQPPAPVKNTCNCTMFMQAWSEINIFVSSAYEEAMNLKSKYSRSEFIMKISTYQKEALVRFDYLRNKVLANLTDQSLRMFVIQGLESLRKQLSDHLILYRRMEERVEKYKLKLRKLRKILLLYSDQAKKAAQADQDELQTSKIMFAPQVQVHMFESSLRTQCANVEQMQTRSMVAYREEDESDKEDDSQDQTIPSTIPRNTGDSQPQSHQRTKRKEPQSRTSAEEGTNKKVESEVVRPELDRPGLMTKSLVTSPTVTLHEIHNLNLGEIPVAKIMCKIFERVQIEISQRNFRYYDLGSFELLNFSSTGTSYDNLEIRLREPEGGLDIQLYKAPEVLQGEQASDKSVSFNMGVIWDEVLMAMGSKFFRTVDDILDTNYVYKPRRPLKQSGLRFKIQGLLLKDKKSRDTLASAVVLLKLVPMDKMNPTGRR